VVFFGVLAAPSSPIPSYGFETPDLNLRSKPIGGISALVSETEAGFKKLSLLESALTKKGGGRGANG
jgi:hypothetical protein